MRRIRSDCCACVASGQTAADPAIPLMRSRRRIACPEAQDYANSPDYIRDLPQAKWGSEAWLHGSKLELRMSALGHYRTFGEVETMSALPPKADISLVRWNVCFVRRVQPVDATPSNLTGGGGVRWRGLHEYGSRRSRGLSFGSAGRTVNVWRISRGRLRGGTRAVSIVSWLSMVALLRSRAGELRER